MPIEADFDDQQRGKREGNYTDCGQDIAKVAPVGGHKIEHAAGDEGKGDRIGTSHPLAVRNDLAITRSDKSPSGADHPGCGLHGGSGKARTARCESDTRERTDEHRDNVDAAENAMELAVTLADSRGEIDGTD
jgi:hypothetical protein